MSCVEFDGGVSGFLAISPVLAYPHSRLTHHRRATWMREARNRWVMSQPVAAQVSSRRQRGSR